MYEYVCNMDFNFFCQNAYEFYKDCIVDCSVLTSEYLKGMEKHFQGKELLLPPRLYAFLLKEKNAKGEYILLLFFEPTIKALFGLIWSNLDAWCLPSWMHT